MEQVYTSGVNLKTIVPAVGMERNMKFENVNPVALITNKFSAITMSLNRVTGTMLPLLPFSHFYTWNMLFQKWVISSCGKKVASRPIKEPSWLWTQGIKWHKDLENRLNKQISYELGYYRLNISFGNLSSKTFQGKVISWRSVKHDVKQSRQESAQKTWTKQIQLSLWCLQSKREMHYMPIQILLQQILWMNRWMKEWAPT